MPAPKTPPPSQRLGQFADRFRNEMIPLAKPFCYYSASASLSDDDRREYLEEPVAALPPTIAARLPEIRILLVPYLEKDELAKAPTSAELGDRLRRLASVGRLLLDEPPPSDGSGNVEATVTEEQGSPSDATPE